MPSTSPTKKPMPALRVGCGDDGAGRRRRAGEHRQVGVRDGELGAGLGELRAHAGGGRDRARVDLAGERAELLLEGGDLRLQQVLQLGQAVRDQRLRDAVRDARAASAGEPDCAEILQQVGCRVAAITLTSLLQRVEPKACSWLAIGPSTVFDVAMPDDRRDRARRVGVGARRRRRRRVEQRRARGVLLRLTHGERERRAGSRERHEDDQERMAPEEHRGIREDPSDRGARAR